MRGRHMWEWLTTVSAVVVNGLLVVLLVLLLVVVLRGCKDRIRMGRRVGAVRLMPY